MRPLKLFISYCHADEALKKSLEIHLAPLVRAKLVEHWHDRRIEGGMNIDKEINSHLESADIILLLLSADFMNSDYCYSKELQIALEKDKQGRARVVPIILRQCYWQTADFSNLNFLPKDAKPIKSFDDMDEAFTQVIQGLRKIVSTLNDDLNFNKTLNIPIVQQKQKIREEKIEPVIKHISIRLTDEVIEQIMRLRETRPRKIGSPKLGVSLRDWISEAILEKLEREKI